MSAENRMDDGSQNPNLNEKKSLKRLTDGTNPKSKKLALKANLVNWIRVEVTPFQS